MKPLYTKEEFEKSEGEDKLPIECCICGKSFMKLKRVILRTLRGIDGYTGDFCSSKCRGVPRKKKLIHGKCENKKCNKEHDGSFGSGRFCCRECANSRSWNEEDKFNKSIANKNSEKFQKSIRIVHEKTKEGRKRGKYKSKKVRIEWQCIVCDKILDITPSEAKNKKYCSGKCRNQVNNKFQTGKRSYAERYLQEKLNEYFPDLKMIFNSRQILKNNRELDLYIPSLEFALEWNGIYHYKKIKKQKLIHIKNKDREKKIECKEMGISLYVVKDLTSNKKFIKEETEKIICIIHGLIHWQDNRTPNPMPE